MSPSNWLDQADKIVGWYLHRVSRYSPRRFVGEMLALSFALKILGVLPLFFMDVDPAADNAMQDIPVGFIVFAALVLAPLLETLFFQWFLVWVVGRFTTRLAIRIACPAAVFALCHIQNGPLWAYAVFYPGLVFNFVFIAKRHESRRKAFGYTALIHALHNVVGLPLMLMVE